MNTPFAFESTHQNGYTYYNVPAGTLLYRGDTDLYMHNKDMQDTPTFFGLEKRFVKNYGLVFTFKTLRDLSLLALDQPNDRFYDESPPPIKKILDAQYGFKNGLRDTVRKKDYELVEYLCQLGFDGYLIDRMSVPLDAVVDDYGEEEEEDMEDGAYKKFHSEMVICAISKNVELVQENMRDFYSDAEIDQAVMKRRELVQKYKDEEVRQAKKNAKRRPRTYSDASDETELLPRASVRPGGLFEDDSDGTPPSSPPRNLNFSTPPRTPGSPPPRLLFDTSNNMGTPSKRLRFGGKYKSKRRRSSKTKGKKKHRTSTKASRRATRRSSKTKRPRRRQGPVTARARHRNGRPACKR